MEFLKHSGKIVLFWLVVFFLNRIVFYSINYALLPEIPLSDILYSFVHALRLDMSMTGYLLAIPFVVYFVAFLFQNKTALALIDVLNAVFIVLYNLAAFGETALYLEWKAKLSMQALLHFQNPDEVVKSASWFLIVLFLGLNIILSGLYIVFYHKYISFKKLNLPSLPHIKRAVVSVILLIVCSAFSVIAIRGGLQQIPIQTSDAYFSKYPLLNDAAVNPLWNISHNILEYNLHSNDNPFKVYTPEHALMLTESMYLLPKDTTVQLLTNTTPNIVYIILESWSAGCIRSFGGDHFAPFTDSLSAEGIIFTQMISSGYVSDQGIPAILSGYPSLPQFSIINLSTKSGALPCISHDLKKRGYTTAFYYGGDLNYGNIRSYLYQKEFDVIKEEKDFPASIHRGQLGIQDNYFYKEAIHEINSLKSPFFSVWFTLSTHMPYDYEGKKEALTKVENGYVNSLKFTDAQLRNFFKEAQKQEWFSNTLFVLVADHSHANHKSTSNFDPEYHRIPLLIYGNPLKAEYRGIKMEKVCSQLDITYSLLKQLNMQEESKHYVWSRDLFNNYSKKLACYCNFGGGGILSENGYISFQNGLNNPILHTIKNKPAHSDSLQQLYKAFQQTVYEDYRNR